ncbi:GNAT family N-acetyltransferase [Marinomonas aquiplantarum]|uniref:RimJ/RimL family protein N-acetyltransferase n=1 Tax=Marinomonas aquiplantarum TaxID=491951 RepID=A0A366CWA2_9GAMM|nr:GNAT family N-acetyltransferase [Marinomonas aquiplantarum]RBO81905.1 RimJ/RimL family protein N-acetyltransferase [Marinomonas aquiplantarum]
MVAARQGSDYPFSQAAFAQPQNEWLAQLQQVQQQGVYAQDRLYWLQQLRAYVDQDRSLVEYQLMLDLAQRLCDWVMVIEIVNAMQSHYPFGQKDEAAITLLCALAEAYFQLGDYAAAIHLYKGALLRFYQNKRILDAYYWLTEKRQQMNKRDFPMAHGRRMGRQTETTELYLTPLESHHIHVFRWLYIHQQQGSKSVAELCNLPSFEDDQQWFDWQQNNQTMPNHDVYAVMHREWGFIGSVCLEVFHGVGFFYYWLGQDFQGYGFGPQAVSLLLEIGVEHNAMHSCYAKVYEDNDASQKAIEKLGFSVLPFRQAAPDDNEILYYLGPEQSEAACRTELETLYRDMGSHIALQHKVWLGE